MNAPTGPSSIVKTRFAPSPTGHLHIGGARTALYNWLLARRLGGRFVLRIEDTDIDRNIAGAEDKIREDLDWLGLTPDESPWVGGPDGPYRQSERLEHYNAFAARLIDSGAAYFAFDTADELNAMREKAKAEKRSFRYARPAGFPTRADADRARAEGRPVVIRMKSADRDVTVSDVILGDVTIRAEEMEDFVIVKSNGWPTYHFAVVADDEMMHITHVVRAQEHLMNTPKHMVLQDALGFRRPIYAHVPIVMNMDGSKMSKRDKHKAVRTRAAEWIRGGKWTADDVARTAGVSAEAAARWLDKADTELDAEQLMRLAAALAVEPPEIEVYDFRRAGYLPEAVLNFIALVGWSPGEDREKMTLADMVSLFSIERIGRTSARFDREKLLAFNTDAAAGLMPAGVDPAAEPEAATLTPVLSPQGRGSDATRSRLLAAFRDYAAVSSSPMAKLDDATLRRALELCRGFRTFHDVDQKIGPIFAPDDQIAYDPDAVKKVLAKGEGRGYAMLEKLLPVLESSSAWSADADPSSGSAAAALEEVIKSFAEQQGAKLGDVAQPLRVALMGRPISPPIGETLALMGRERTSNRIRRCLAKGK